MKQIALDVGCEKYTEVKRLAESGRGCKSHQTIYVCQRTNTNLYLPIRINEMQPSKPKYLFIFIFYLMHSYQMVSYTNKNLYINWNTNRSTNIQKLQKYTLDSQLRNKNKTPIDFGTKTLFYVIAANKDICCN